MGTAVVTGAAGGIGRALAERLAAEGHRVHLVDVAPTVAVAASLDGVPHVADVADPEAMEELAAIAADAELVCLNAGIVGSSLGPPWEVPDDEWTRLIGVNLLGVVNGLRAFVPRLLASERPAHIVVTASLAGLVTFPGGGAYAATKHAVVALAEQTALCLARTQVSVTVLCPALVRTGMSAEGEDPAVIAAAALAAARSGRFLVVPDEWRPAVSTRTHHLLSGTVPSVPTPDSTHHDRSPS